VQHEYFPRARRQLLDRALEVDLEIRAGRSHREQIERRRVVRHPLALNRKRSPPLDDDVDGKAVKPGRKRRVPAKLAQLLPGPHEDVLRDLVGLLRAEHPAREAVNPRHVRPVETFEGSLVPAGRQGHIAVEATAGLGFAV
jgi:hypothetical protein